MSNAARFACGRTLVEHTEESLRSCHRRTALRKAGRFE